MVDMQATIVMDSCGTCWHFNLSLPCPNAAASRDENWEEQQLSEVLQVCSSLCNQALISDQHASKAKGSRKQCAIMQAFTGLVQNTAQQKPRARCCRFSACMLSQMCVESCTKWPNVASNGNASIQKQAMCFFTCHIIT